MKKTLKILLVKILGYQVRQLLKKNDVKVIGVVGSVGKTSTKYAIASTLAVHKRVQWQKGNYNDILSVPLVVFGHELPNIYNPIAWLRIMLQNNRTIKNGYDYDVVVLELGTDGPGQIGQFGNYLGLDIGVVTAIAPEHMEFFNTIDEVAEEELAVSGFAKKLIINEDLIDDEYVKSLGAIRFGLRSNDVRTALDISMLTISSKGKAWIKYPLSDGATTLAYSLTAAAIVARELGVDDAQIKSSFKDAQVPAGRMQILEGINGTTIIDDTYNASPEAVKAALDYLYTKKATQKIAMLGNMNELGHYSKEAHVVVGEYCDPKKLDYVITVGPDANKFLAPSAKDVGCHVETFQTPYDAGEFVKTILKPGAVILAKGSQNNVYMEEAVKLLLAKPSDQERLVRQSPRWLAKKRKNFAK